MWLLHCTSCNSFNELSFNKVFILRDLKVICFLWLKQVSFKDIIILKDLIDCNKHVQCSRCFNCCPLDILNSKNWLSQNCDLLILLIINKHRPVIWLQGTLIIGWLAKKTFYNWWCYIYLVMTAWLPVIQSGNTVSQLFRQLRIFETGYSIQ